MCLCNRPYTAHHTPAMAVTITVRIPSTYARFPVDPFSPSNTATSRPRHLECNLASASISPAHGACDIADIVPRCWQTGHSAGRVGSITHNLQLEIRCLDI